MSGLPRGWVEVPLCEVAKSMLGKMLDKSKHTAGSKLPYLRNINVRWNCFALDDLYEMYFEERELERYGVEPGDVLVCEGGEPGRAAVWRGPSGAVKYQKALHRVRPSQGLLPDWFVFSLKHDAQRGTLSDLFTGTTIKHFTGKSLERYPIRVPPVPEQRRIVTKIEALQARSRAAREALDAVGPLLEKFRQSVLAAAFRGDLTADWRKKNPNVEPASVLLERIRKEGRQRWEQDQLAKMKAKGKAPKDNRWKAKYEEPKPVDTEGLPELPKGWCWASLLELSGVDDNSMTDGPFGSNLKSAHYVPSGVRVVRLGNLGLGVFKDTDQSFVTEDHFQTLRRHEVFPGDLLIAALAEPVGRCCELPAHAAPALVKADCIRFAPSGHIDRKLVLHWMNSPPGLAQCEALSHGIGRLRINMANLRLMPVALPPRDEQGLLVDRVDQALRQLESLSETLRRSEAAMPALDQSVLATAFRGELVPQDPNDEPAAALLAKLQAATPASAKPTKRGRKPKAS